MNYINYKTHLILQSNYKIIIIMLIYTLIYLSFYENNIIYCMVEETEGTIQTEPVLVLSQQSQAIVNEIKDYIGPQIDQIDFITKQNQIIAKQSKKILNLQLEIDRGDFYSSQLEKRLNNTEQLAKNFLTEANNREKGHLGRVIGTLRGNL